MSLTLTMLGSGSAAFVRGARVALPANGWPLIGYLLAAPIRQAHRSALAEALWPDHDPAAARHSLATALWRMKAAFGPSFMPLTLSSDVVTFAPAARTWIDSVALERRLRPLVDDPGVALSPVECRRLRRVMASYRGDFLPDVDAEWALLERERLRTLWLDGLYALAHAHARLGEWEAVVALARVLCGAEPLREDAHRLLMSAYARAGNRALAIRQYRTCAAVLARELGVEPMEQTMTLFRSLAGRTAGPETRPAPRDRLLAARHSLQAALQDVEAAIAGL